MISIDRTVLGRVGRTKPTAVRSNPVSVETMRHPVRSERHSHLLASLSITPE